MPVCWVFILKDQMGRGNMFLKNLGNYLPNNSVTSQKIRILN